MLRLCAGGLLLCSLAVLAGCDSRPARVKPPAIDPQQAAMTAMAEYDTNGDGMLDADELAKAPALKSALKDIDKNGDGKISADEIVQRIENWQASKIGIMAFNCKVTLDKAPLAGATVTLIPEKFLGPNMLPATGTTGDQGYAIVSIAKDKLPKPNLSGVAPGLYRVEISKQSGGKEVIPARYNVNTELGQEIAQGVEALMTGVSFNLQSR